MGNKISTNEPSRNPYLALAKDPGGDTNFNVVLHADARQEDTAEDRKMNKGRIAVRENNDILSHVGVVAQASFANTMEINQLPFPTLICDTGCQIIAANSSFYELTGFPEATCEGKSFLDLIQESHPDEAFPLNEYFLSTEKDIEEREVYLHTSSNAMKYVLLRFRLLERVYGTSQQILIQLVDITRRNEAEVKLEKKSEELERFVYSTSHDLRAPLRSIMGLIYIIQQESNPDVIKTYLDMIRSSVNRMDNFIKEIVDLSRNSRQPINKEEIDLNQVVTEIFDSLRFIPGAEKIDFILTMKQVRSFVSDSSRIKVVLNNLISNAIAYHRLQQDHPFIEVKINVTNKYCYIEVTDNGRGIQKEHQTKIFDMFYRASDDAKGSGLGLYIVKEAVQKLNGEIRIKSTWGEGTTFSLKFFNHEL